MHWNNRSYDDPTSNSLYSGRIVSMIHNSVLGDVTLMSGYWTSSKVVHKSLT